MMIRDLVPAFHSSLIASLARICRGRDVANAVALAASPPILLPSISLRANASVPPFLTTCLLQAQRWSIIADSDLGVLNCQRTVAGS